jgi:CDC45-like protein
MAYAFRYVFLENDYLKDVQLFQYPLALQKLALFVMETYRAKSLKTKDKPMVMVVKNTKKGTSLIIGVMDYNRSSNYVKK